MWMYIVFKEVQKMCLPNNKNLLKIQCPEYDFSHAKFQSNQSVTWPRVKETVGIGGKVVTWKGTDRVDAINPVFVKVVFNQAYGELNVTPVYVLQGGTQQQTLTNQSISEGFSSLIHSALFWLSFFSAVFVSILSTWSWSRPPPWPASCVWGCVWECVW